MGTPVVFSSLAAALNAGLAVTAGINGGFLVCTQTIGGWAVVIVRLR